MSIEKLLLDRHPAPEWLAVQEAANGTGSMGRGRFDVVAINCWPSNGYTRVVYEVKRSRADFKRELDNPGKRADAEKYFHQAWFVCAHGIAKEDEIPDGWGLITVTKAGDKLRLVKMARHREPADMPLTMLLSIFRKGLGELTELRKMTTIKFGGREITEADLQNMVTERMATNRAVDRQIVADHAKRAQEAVDAMRLAVAPLNQLRTRAGEYVNPHSPPPAMTEKDVDTLIETAVARHLAQFPSAIEHARDKLNKLLELIKENGSGH